MFFSLNSNLADTSLLRSAHCYGVVTGGAHTVMEVLRGERTLLWRCYRGSAHCYGGVKGGAHTVMEVSRGKK